MSLNQSFDQQGNFLFRYRGQFPVFLFLLAIPFIYTTDYKFIVNYLHFLYIIGCIISFLGFLIRFYTIGTTPKGTSGRNTKKQIAETLNMLGMYSVVRHPLYLGNYLIWLGISITTCNMYFIIIMSFLFWLFYERIMFAEEKFLINKFGKEYFEWSSQTPAFFPCFSNFKSPEMSFSLITILRREYASVLSCVIGFVYIEFLKNYSMYGCFKISTLTLYILIFLLVIVIILRSLKHYTKILNEDNRS